jgi:hypothetical protein
MTQYFDELMQMWKKTTDEHVRWLKNAKNFSVMELFVQIRQLIRDDNEFEEKTKHMKDAIGEAILLAAKFKNQYEINRFLVSVLTELSMRLLQMSEEMVTSLKNKTVIKSKRIVLSKEMKKAIAKQVKLEISKLKD